MSMLDKKLKNWVEREPVPNSVKYNSQDNNTFSNKE